MAVTYRVYLTGSAHDARRALPGHVRQRIAAAIDALHDEPRPIRSRPLSTTGIDVPDELEIRRVRLDRWRIVYAIHDRENWVVVLAIRRRPPYDYEDLDTLVRAR